MKKIFSEDEQDWFSMPALTGLDNSEVIALLDTQSYFDLLDQSYPTTQDAVLKFLLKQGFILSKPDGWTITNLGAILLAKKLNTFPVSLARKAPRLIIYEGTNKLHTRQDIPGTKGYAVGFKGLIDFIHSASPKNKLVEEVLREEVRMFPKRALRELIANALVHQDFQITGGSVVIEMFDDRVEISNPGIPPISVARFIDENQSRNELLAHLMRLMRICEEKGSGIDKVVATAEHYLLPAPDFIAGENQTKAILYSQIEFTKMSKSDRIRACYQHCVLQWINNAKMSNQSLRKRFGLDDSPSSSASASQVIAATREDGLIKPLSGETSSTRYVRYVPN